MEVETQLPVSTRLATEADMTSIYMMGYDVWGEGDSISVHLYECQTSPKYKKGQWYVLADAHDNLLSSLIRYQLDLGTAGLGSIATPPELRKRGWATRLITDVLAQLTSEGVKTVYLFADIAPEFYEKFGFQQLPKEHQRYPKTCCMVWGTPVAHLVQSPNYTAPTYF